VREQPDLSEEKRAEYLDHVLNSAGILLERIDAIMRAAAGGGTDEEIEPEPVSTELVPILRDALSARAATIFVSRADVADHLPRVAVGEEGLVASLSILFDAITQNGRVREAIGCAAKVEYGDLKGVVLTIDLLSADQKMSGDTVAELSSQLREHGVEMQLTNALGFERLSLFLPALIEKQAA
jgi:hypothetical protein